MCITIDGAGRCWRGGGEGDRRSGDTISVYYYRASKKAVTLADITT